jgi:hypothetical protein
LVHGFGGVGEWLKPAVLKTVRPQKGLVGSNPTPSATEYNVALELEGLPFRLRRTIARLFITVLSTPRPFRVSETYPEIPFQMQGNRVFDPLSRPLTIAVRLFSGAEIAPCDLPGVVFR